MWLLRRLHQLILLTLAGIGVLVCGVFLYAAQISLEKSPAIQQHFRDLLTSDTSSPIDTPLAPQEENVTLTFGTLKVSTPSATLTRVVSPNEELFIPFSSQIRRVESLPRLFSPGVPHPQLLTWDEARVQSWVAQVSAAINTYAVAPSVTHTPRSSRAFTVTPGKAGTGADIQATASHIVRSPSLEVVYEMPSVPVALPLTAEQIEKIYTRLSRLSSQPLSFTAQGKTFTVTPAVLASLIGLPDGFSLPAIKDLVSSWGKEINQSVVEPELAFDGKEITTFKAPVEGRHVDPEKNAPLILAALTAHEEMQQTQPLELIVTSTSPKVTLASLNSLGITERIGRGNSEYAHSIPNRIKNVALTTSRIHASIIMPGETFSFNKALGDVSAATGFLPAYVISQGKTVLGDGGGVCQVSSTLFRALLDAGLPILERRGHSYRVGYYEQNSRPGFDATVYAPHPDLTFLNDTGSPILINAQADSTHTKMYIELYGKSDGRKAEVLNYKQWDQSPAPPPMYQDDPSLPTGTLKQIDFAAGGLKISFDYKVSYPDGAVKQTTYTTIYTPWRAVYLRGIQ